GRRDRGLRDDCVADSLARQPPARGLRGVSRRARHRAADRARDERTPGVLGRGVTAGHGSAEVAGNSWHAGIAPRAACAQRAMHRGIALAPVLASTAARADVAYVEALGKAGAYGLGYDHELGWWSLSAGGAASFIVVRGQQLLTLAPYLHAPLVERRCNALF